MATRFLYDNAWAAGVATASSSDISFTPESTRNLMRGLPWRSSTGVIDVWLANNFGSIKTISAVALMNPRVVGTLVVTAKVQASVDGLSWADVTGSTFTQNTSRTDLWTAWFTPVNTQYLRVYFTRVSGSGYVQIGEVMAGSYFEPTYDIDVTSFSIERVDLSALTKGRSGMISRSSYPQYEKFPLNFQQMPAADGAAFRLMFQTVGIGGMLILTLDPTNADYTWFGYFESSMVHQATDVPDAFNIQLRFSEAL